MAAGKEAEPVMSALLANVVAALVKG
jgi:hypothetical protein